MAIDLNLDEQQRMVRDTARDFFDANCPPALVRRYENGEDAFPRQLWAKMAELGWLGMCFPEAYEGLGCGFLDMYALYVEIGRYLVPSPHLDTVALAGELIARLGDEAVKQALLPSIAAGTTIVSCAITEPDGLYGPRGVRLAARRAGDGFVLDGQKALVNYAGVADRLLVAARTGGAGEEGVSLFLVDPRAGGVALERTPNMAGYPLCAVTFDGAPGALLGPLGQAWPALHETMMKAAVLQSAMIVGAGERVLEITAGYARDRVQFGEPIGKHQFVQALVTEVAIQGQVARLMGLHAAWRIDAGLPFLREASLAKAAASKAAAAMTFSAHEVHAGIGFMIDYDLQLYTMRAKHWEWNLGDARYHLERVIVESEGKPLRFEAAAELDPELVHG